jgi:hypothetical protein
MLFERQRLLLNLLDVMGEPLAGTDFQKLLFLYTHEWETEPSYDFVPYQFGGFSFTSYADKRKLISRGLLVDDDKRWELTAEGRKSAAGARPLRELLSRFRMKQGTLRGDALIREVYVRHPYYATRSKIAARVLKTAAEKAKVTAAQPSKKEPGVVTIGYEGKTLERYLNQLIQDGVTVLCDVRRNPLSRKYGFSKSTLRNACETVGIRYEHLPQLGIDSEDRRNLVTQADYDALFADYERMSLPKQKPALDTIRQWVKEGERVALTCYEALPCQCHRHCVAEALKGLPVSHL